MLKGITFALLLLFAARPMTALGCELACSMFESAAPETAACHGATDDANPVTLQGVPPHCADDCAPIPTLRVLPRVFTGDPASPSATSDRTVTHAAVAGLAAVNPPGSTRPVSPPALHTVLRI